MTMTATESENRAMPDKLVIDDKTLDTLTNRIEAEGLELLGPDGVLTEPTSRIMNRGLEAKMSHHLGYEKGDQAGWGSGNNRNGRPSQSRSPQTAKALSAPIVVPKHSRFLEGFNNLVCGLLGACFETSDRPKVQEQGCKRSRLRRPRPIQGGLIG